LTAGLVGKDYVKRVLFLEEPAVGAVLGYHGVNGSQAGKGWGKGLSDALGPETGGGFMMAGVVGVWASGCFVVVGDGGAEAVEGDGEILPEPGGGDRRMGGVCARGFGERSGEERKASSSIGDSDSKAECILVL